MPTLELGRIKAHEVTSNVEIFAFLAHMRVVEVEPGIEVKAAYEKNAEVLIHKGGMAAVLAKLAKINAEVINR